MAKFNEFNSAVRFKNVVERIATATIQKVYPAPRYAVVTAVDNTNRKVTIEYPDESGTTFTVPVHTFMPVTIGTTVRVNGPAGARYVDETLDGVIALNKLRLLDEDDVDLSSTAHALQIGDDAGPNLAFDINEVIARDNGADTILHLNQTGGEVRLSGGNFRINGTTISDASGRQFYRADDGRGNSQVIQRRGTTDTSDANGLISITFTEAFTSTPLVVAVRDTANIAERTCQIYSASTTGFVVRCFAEGAIQASTSNITINWIAIGNKSDV